LFLLQQNLGWSSSRPYTFSKPASPPSSPLMQVAILWESTPNAAGQFWEAVSFALGMRRIHKSVVWGKLEHTEETRVEVICFGEDIARKAVAALKT
jgi:hypothetical protein